MGTRSPLPRFYRSNPAVTAVGNTVQVSYVETEKTWVGSLLYPIPRHQNDVVDEKDVEVAIDLFLYGADMVVEEGQSDREGII